MSTNTHCEIVRTEEGKWYLGLEMYRGQDPIHWDGPFDCELKAEEYLSDNYANPGAITTIEYDATNPTPPEKRELLRKANKPQAGYTIGGFRFSGRF